MTMSYYIGSWEVAKELLDEINSLKRWRAIDILYMKSKVSKLVDEILQIEKKASPHIKLKDKGDADLFFEHVDPDERIEFYEDLNSVEEPEIDLPNFGIIEDEHIINKEKSINKDDIDNRDEKLIEPWIRDKRKVPRPFIEYDQNKHKFDLNPKYNLEKILKEPVSV